jgi:hypothetical protein
MYQVILSEEEISFLRNKLRLSLKFKESVLADPDAEKVGVNVKKVNRKVKLYRRILKNLTKEKA